MTALRLEDPRWKSLRTGFGNAFDLRPYIKRLFNDEDSRVVMRELRDELCNQGQQGDAEYALVPWIVRFVEEKQNFDSELIGFVLDVELWRPRNAEIADFLAEAYFDSIRRLPRILLAGLSANSSDFNVRLTAAAIGFACEKHKIGELYLEDAWRIEEKRRADAIENPNAGPAW